MTPSFYKHNHCVAVDFYCTQIVRLCTAKIGLLSIQLLWAPADRVVKNLDTEINEKTFFKKGSLSQNIYIFLEILTWIWFWLNYLLCTYYFLYRGTSACFFIIVIKASKFEFCMAVFSSEIWSTQKKSLKDNIKIRC